MSFSLLFVVCFACALAFWISGRIAAENALIHGQRACQHGGVQWLDQSVHQVRLRLRRDSEGRLRWERQYRFEYSSGGDDRHAGLITMLGSALSGLTGPMPVKPPTRE